MKNNNVMVSEWIGENLVLDGTVGAWYSMAEFDMDNDMLVPWYGWANEADRKAEFLEEGVPTHVCRVVTQFDGLSLVDGFQVYFTIVDGDIDTIWEEAWQGNQPDYYGGSIEGSMDWCSAIGTVAQMSL